MSNTETTAAAPARRRRPPPRPAVVTDIIQVSPRVRRIRFGGEKMLEFNPPKPSAHIKIFVNTGDWSPESDAPRPPNRTYTPRLFNPATGELDVEFVLHGVGLASEWAEGAKVGDQVWIGGPGGGFEPDPALRHIVMLADESALPAAGMILEALPADCRATIVCEVENAGEERPLSPTAAAEPTWLARGDARYSARLEAAAATVEVPDDALWWVACEAMAMRNIRKHLLLERKLDKTRLITRGYWQAGETNHPDHDYGED